MAEKQYNDWYKKQFNNLNEKPPVEVWNNISSKLDVQDVWKSVDSKLNSIARRKIILRRTAYSISFLLLLFIGNYIIHSERAVEHKIIIANKSDNKSAIKNNSVTNEYVPLQKENNNIINSHFRNDKTENQSSLSNTKSGVKTNTLKASELTSVIANKSSDKTNYQELGSQSSLSVNESKEQIKSLKTEPQSSVTKDESTVNTETVKDSFAEIKNENSTKDIYTATTTTDNIICLNTKDEREELHLFSIKNSFIPVNINDSTLLQLALNNYVADSNYFDQSSLGNEFHGLYAGGIISGNNTWLFNQLLFNGLNSNSLEETNLNFGYAYGVSFGYNFNSNFGGEINWYINSQQGQTYHRYNEGQYQTSKIKLNYSIVNLTLKYRKAGVTRLFNLPKSNNLILGINCGFLINSSDGSELEKTKSLYSTTDYGLRFGYEYEILAFKRIIFSSALNGDFGLKNIYKGNSLTPGSFNHTHTASLGLQIGIKYLLK